MPSHGGMTPYPRRMGGTGGGAYPVLKSIVTSLAAQMGTAYDTTSTSNVFPGIMGAARAIAGAWSDNARLANQWDSTRMTDFVGRWETILAIYPSPTDTMAARRARIDAAFKRIVTYPTYQGVYDTVAKLLGPVFVTIVHSSVATNAPNVIAGVLQSPIGPAGVFTPSTWPFGSHDSTGAIDWASSVGKILIQVHQPAGWTDAQFYAQVATIGPAIDGLLPAWVDWEWFRVLNTNETVFGFFLDGDVTKSGSLTNLDSEPMT